MSTTSTDKTVHHDKQLHPVNDPGLPCTPSNPEFLLIPPKTHLDGFLSTADLILAHRETHLFICVYGT
jgi:hypothetical protein